MIDCNTRLIDQIIIGRHGYYLRDIAHQKLKVLRNPPPNLDCAVLNDLRLKHRGSDLDPICANRQSGNLISAVSVRHCYAPYADLTADCSDLNCRNNCPVLIVDLSFNGGRGLCVDGTAQEDKKGQRRRWKTRPCEPGLPQVNQTRLAFPDLAS